VYLVHFVIVQMIILFIASLKKKIVQRRVINAPMRKGELIKFEGMKKSRGILKITLIEVVKRACDAGAKYLFYF
jgi:hypothetical protein